MTRNSKNEYSNVIPYIFIIRAFLCAPRFCAIKLVQAVKNEYSKNGYEKSEYSKNQKNSRDCNHVKDREMSSYGQQNREQDEKDEYEKY